MASKRVGAPAQAKQAAPSPAISQQKHRSPSPSSPPSLTLKDVQDALQEAILQINKQTEELLRKNNEELSENLSQIFHSFADNIERVDARVEEVAEKVEVVEDRIDKAEDNIEINQNDIVMFQYREMEHALRIRGLKENLQEKLLEEIATAIAPILECSPEIILGEIEKVYRVNSWFARQKNLPRDVVVYFTRKARRNEVIQAFYQHRFQIAAQDVIILKEIPSKILRKRKEFAFLTQELKKQQVSFRWDIPTGIVVTYAGIRYRLNTVQKAKDFFSTILKADMSSPSQFKDKEAQPEQLVVELPLTSVWTKEPQTQLMEEIPREQRMTRAAHRRREREQQREMLPTVTSPSSQPVGGARPKTSAMSDLRGKFQQLYKPKDG